MGKKERKKEMRDLGAKDRNYEAGTKERKK